MADLQQEYGFFNYDEAVLESTGKYDREYTAEDFAKYFALFVGNGVFANPASQLMVKIAATKQTPYNVTVEPGWAFINGYWYHLQQKATLTIPVNTSSQTKYQRVVVRYNNTTREIGLTIVEAVSETIEPTRNDAIYDLALAQIVVKSNVSVLSASDVKDLRPSSKYCGYVAGVVDQIDAGTLYDNLTEQFNEWFAGVKDQLQQDEAIKLQNQIGNLEELNTEQKNNLVSAVNSAVEKSASDLKKTDDKIGSLASLLTTKKDNIVEAVNEIYNLVSASILEKTYPVGSVYMSFNETSPATLFGGTWVEIGDENNEWFPLFTAVNNAGGFVSGSVGGEEKVKLTINQIPSHTHKLSDGMGAVLSIGTKSDVLSNKALGFVMQSNNSWSGLNKNVLNIANTGGTQSHNNMPPYIRVYAWRRTK